MIKSNVSVSVDTKDIAPKVKGASNKTVGLITQQVVKDSNFYIPADTWMLRDSSLLHSKFEEGKAIWWTSYAKTVYYGTNFNFRKDKNPHARALWFESAKSAKLDTWNRLVDRAVKSGL